MHTVAEIVTMLEFNNKAQEYSQLLVDVITRIVPIDTLLHKL
jgi:hypothetical protein